MFEDVKAILANDPACRNIEFLLYPCLHAIVAHRYLIHPLYKLGMPFFPRLALADHALRDGHGDPPGRVHRPAGSSATTAPGSSSVRPSRSAGTVSCSTA